jgi:hypothetical protein
MYFTEQPMPACPAREALDFGATALDYLPERQAVARAAAE